MSTNEQQEYDFKAIEDKWRDYWRENGFLPPMKTILNINFIT